MVARIDPPRLTIPRLAQKEVGERRMRRNAILYGRSRDCTRPTLGEIGPELPDTGPVKFEMGEAGEPPIVEIASPGGGLNLVALSLRYRT